MLSEEKINAAKEWLNDGNNKQQYSQKIWDYMLEMLKELAAIQSKINERKKLTVTEIMNDSGLVDGAILEMKKTAMVYMFCALMTANECKVLITDKMLCYYAVGKNVWLGTIRDGKKYVAIIEGIETSDYTEMIFSLWKEAETLYKKIQSDAIKKADWAL